MKTTHTGRRMSFGLAALGWTLAGVALTPLGAQATHRRDEKPVSGVYIRVATLHDAGGLTVKVNRQTLNESLTQGFQKYLTTNANGRYVVVSRASEEPKNQPATLRFTLEGELSHLTTGAQDGGPYLCVLRLFLEGRSRKLVSQWAGTAQTFRYLSSNIRNEPGVDVEGLVGECGKRIIASLVAASGGERTAQFNQFVEAASRRKRMEVAITTARRPDAATDSVQAGEGYYVKIDSQEEGAVYIVGVGMDGRLRPLFTPEAGHEIGVAPGHSVTLPAQTPFRAEATSEPREQEIIVLVRCKAAPTAPAPRDVPFVLPPNTPITNTDSTGLPVQIVGTDSKGLPVQVVGADMASLLALSSAPALTRLLAMTTDDPPGQWAALRIKLKILPKARS